MFDDVRRFQKNQHLLQLLDHYAQAGAADRDAWLDRRMQLADVDPHDLSRLHGQLIAFGWIEQNTGVITVLLPGTCAQSYRTTAAGRRALQQARADREADLEDAA